MNRFGRLLPACVALAFLGAQAAPAASFLFWKRPDFSGAPVRGDEPGIVLPMPGATEKEYRASLLWGLRAGLNVAALKCQFAPVLASVPNYNGLLAHHARELNDAYKTVQGYFQRTGGKGWQNQFDQYTTRTYNGFSTLMGEQGFCDTAAEVGREAIAQRKGDLHLTAENRMRELRNSLLPAGDGLRNFRTGVSAYAMPSLEANCWDKKDHWVTKKCGALPPEMAAAPAPPVAPPAPALAVDNKAFGTTG